MVFQTLTRKSPLITHSNAKSHFCHILAIKLQSKLFIPKQICVLCAPLARENRVYVANSHFYRNIQFNFERKYSDKYGILAHFYSDTLASLTHGIAHSHTVCTFIHYYMPGRSYHNSNIGHIQFSCLYA